MSDALRAVASTIANIANRPRLVVPGLILAQLGVTAGIALATPHNGLVWYQGGDQLWYATSGWLLAHLELPPTNVGYGWPVVLAPIMGPLGPEWVRGLPLVLPLNVLVLGPLLLIAVYGIATRIAGRVFALWTGILWVVAPVATIPLFVERYHDRYVDAFLPQAAGLTALADFPSMVAVAVSALFVLRSLELRSWHEGAVAGLAAGFALGVKPANALFLVGVGLAYVIALRWRPAAAFAAGLAPSVVVLAIWKQRGLGELPLFSLGEAHLAAQNAATQGIVLAESWFDRFVPLDWDVFEQNMASLREYFWSATLAKVIPFAGAIAVARRSLPAAALLLGWALSYVLVKGSSPVATIASGSFWRLVMPAWPAYLLLFAAIPLLVPRLSPRLASAPVRRPVGVTAVAVAAALLVLVPLAVVSVARPLGGPERAVAQRDDDWVSDLLTPVSDDVRVETERRGESVVVRWDAPAYRPGTFYRLFRTVGANPDVTCDTTAAAYCVLDMIPVTSTRDRSWVDGSPPPGVTYRVGVATNWLDDPTQLGDVFVVSPPATAAG